MDSGADWSCICQDLVPKECIEPNCCIAVQGHEGKKMYARVAKVPIKYKNFDSTVQLLLHSKTAQAPNLVLGADILCHTTQMLPIMTGSQAKNGPSRVSEAKNSTSP